MSGRRWFTWIFCGCLLALEFLSAVLRPGTLTPLQLLVVLAVMVPAILLWGRWRDRGLAAPDAERAAMFRCADNERDRG